jgi:DNA polymerase IV
VRIILHADMDAFFTSVEQLDDPSLRGRPVLVGGESRRGVVSAASYEARISGCRSAMPMHEARRRCPEAIIRPPRFERYTAVSSAIMSVFHDFSPLVEPLSLDEAFLDMSGAERIFGAPEQMGARLKAAVREATGLTISVGASTSKFVAKVASDQDKPDGLTIVPPDAVRSFLDPLPVSRLWGVGAKTLPRLEAMGLRTIGDVAYAEPSLLRGLGDLGAHLRRLALADDPRPVIPERDPKSVGAEFTLEANVRGERAILPHLRRAADKVARRLRKTDVLAAGVRVKLKTADFRLWTRQATLQPPTDAAAELLAAGQSLLAHFDLSEPMRLIGIAAYELKSTASTPIQADLFASEGRARTRQLDQTLDALKERFGDAAVRRGSDLDE